MARPRRSETREETGRRARRLLGGADYKMAIPEAMKDPAYEYRFFNDSNNRLSSAEEADWEFVEEADVHIGTGAESNNIDSHRVSMIVGTNENGTPKHAYLMRKKKEWHEEDQSAKQQKIDTVENQMRNRVVEGGLGRDVSYGNVNIGRG